MKTMVRERGELLSSLARGRELKRKQAVVWDFGGGFGGGYGMLDSPVSGMA